MNFSEIIELAGSASAKMKPQQNTGYIENIYHDIVYPEVFNIFPNPASDKLLVEYSLPENEGLCTIELYSIEGKLLLTVPVRQQIGIEEIDVSGFSSGLYLLSIGNAGEKKQSNRINITK